MAQHYLDNLGGWHELPDASFEHLLSQNHPGLTFTPKTQAEYEAAINPPKTTAQLLADAKVAKNEQINQWRKDANSTSFTWQTKQIACDALSRSDIDAIASYIGMNNALPTTFPNAWKAMDNTLIPIPDVATFKAMHQAMIDCGAANFARSQTLKANLAAAKTIAAVDKIVW